MKNVRELVISLAALCQACVLVDKLAFDKSTDDRDIKTQFHALFQLEAKDIQDIYPSLFQLKSGLRYLRAFLRKENTQSEANSLRYILSLMHLTQKFLKDKEMIKTVRTRLTQGQRQLDFFDLNHPTIAALLADLYSQTLSTFNYKIFVQGLSPRLKDTHTANQIRALLLSGVRAVVLWRQMGGNRLQFLTSRRALLAECDALIAESKYQPVPTEREIL